MIKLYRSNNNKVIITQKSGQGVRPAEYFKIKDKENFARLRVATLKVGTRIGR